MRERAMRSATILLAAAMLCWRPGVALAQEDAGEDGGLEDGGVEDALVEDATTADTTLPDTAQPDTSLPDTAQPDSSLPDAAQPDTSLPDTARPDAASACGEVSFLGECQGDVVRYCNGEQVVEVDCVARFGASATCGLFDCTDEAAGCYGYFCVVRPGEPCVVGDMPCDASANQGCIDGVCAASTICDPATYTPLCDGTSLTHCSHTVNELDCSEGGEAARTCGMSSSGYACVGLAGDACGGDTERECAQGLTCEQEVCTSAQVDAGPAGDSGEPGDGDGDGDDGCQCGGAPAPASLLPPLLLILAGCAWRRRRAKGA